jgi:hypothetical protein
MTRKITLAVTVVTALVLAAPALGKGQRVEEPQTALQARSEALNRMHGLGAYQPSLKDRSEALNRMYGLGAYAASVDAIEARERAFGAKRDAQLGSLQSPDVVQRAIEAHTRSIREPVGDDRFRIDPTSGPAPVSVTTSGREVEWPQIGIGFGIGLLLAVGLAFALRLTRTRQLAH